MRWHSIQFSYNICSFMLILYLLITEITRRDLKDDDIKHTSQVNELAKNIDEKVAEIEDSIRQANLNIELVKKSQKSSRVDNHSQKSFKFQHIRPHIYVITPTYVRWTQKAELTRIGQSLASSKVPIHWVIVEDTDRGYPARILQNFQKKFNSWVDSLSVTILTAATDPKFKLQSDDPNWLFPRGASQRNKGLDFISNFGSSLNFYSDNLPQNSKEYLPSHLQNSSAVVYFADDDNTYDHELFNELTQIPDGFQIGVLPVGIVGGLAWEGPICSIESYPSKVLEFHTAWKPERPFPLDMAGFVVKLEQIKNSNARFSYYTMRGYLETDFLLKYIGTPMVNKKWNNVDEYKFYLKNLKEEALEKTVGLIDSCSRVLVWHTRTEKPKDKDEMKLKKLGGGSPDMEI